MSNQKPGLMFRLPSWFAPSSASSSNNNSSNAAKKSPPSDKNISRNKPPGKVSQNSNSISHTSKTNTNSPPQARITSQPQPDKPASPTKVNTQPITPPRVASQPKAKPVQPSPAPSPQLPSTSKESSQSGSKPEKPSDHEFKSTEEVDSKSSPQINSPKVVTQQPQSEAIIGSELKSIKEVVSKQSSPKRSPQPATKDSSQLPATITEPTSAIDGEPAVANSLDQEKITHSEIKGLPKEQMSTSPENSETPFPAPGSNSTNMNHRSEEIIESHLKPEVAKQVTTKVQETADKELVKEKKVINGLQQEESGPKKHIEEQKVAVQPQHTNGETEKYADESTSNSRQNKLANQPRHRDSDGDFHQEPAEFKGKDFPINNVSTNKKPQLEEKATSVITLAGDNRGATMEISSSSSRKDQELHIHRGYNNNQEETNESTIATEEIQNKPDSDKQKHIDDHAGEMYINSNIQCINNAIMLNSSIQERDPGLHIVRSRTGMDSDTASDKKQSVTHKSEFNITKAQKHTYEPNVRRRCLRGLMMESSDSDPDNPEKPRRHGCRVACNKVDIL